MTMPKPTAGPARINSTRHTTVAVALDTVALLAARITKMLEAGRRMTMTYRVVGDGARNATDVTPGLTVAEPPKLTVNKGEYASFGVQLDPPFKGFGFGAYASDGATTEAAVWEQYNADPDDRRSITLVTVTGGMPGDRGPDRDDRIVILYWNREGVCIETVVAFDYDTGRHNSVTELLTELGAYLTAAAGNDGHQHLFMLQRIQRALAARGAVDGGDE